MKMICNVALGSDVCSRAGTDDGGGLFIKGGLNELIQGQYTSKKRGGTMIERRKSDVSETWQEKERSLVGKELS